jgi:hypothetical protein
MNKSLEKLFNILKNKYNKVVPDIKKDTLSMLRDPKCQTRMADAVVSGTFATWLSFTEEELEHNVIFDNFTFLSSLLEEKGLSDKDVFNIINYVLKRNIGAAILDDEVIVQPADFSLANFNTNIFSLQNIKEYGKDATYFESYIRMQKQRMACETYEPNTKEGLYDRDLTELENLKKQHTIMHNGYLTKEETFTEYEMVGICAALLHLGLSLEVTKKYCCYMKVILDKRLEKEAAPVKQKIQEPIRIVQPVQEVKPINRRLIKKTFKELETYFDFFNMEPIRPLTYDEMILCLAKLKQTDVTEGLLNEFISKIDRYNAQTDPVLHASNILRRLKAYQETFEDKENSDYRDVTNGIKVLEEYLTEYNATEDQEEKDVWTEYIVDETPHALSLLPKTK